MEKLTQGEPGSVMDHAFLEPSIATAGLGGPLADFVDPPPPAPSFATVSITNQLSEPIDIYDEFNPSTDPQQKVPLLYTKLKTIGPGETAQVQSIREVALLLATVTGTVTELNGNFYYQFPIKAMSGTQLHFGDPPPLADTVGETDRSAAIASFKFHKYLIANPDAALSKSFNAALPKGFAAVNAFFAASQNFKQCTMASWNGIMTWLMNATSGWQGPYYLYDSSSAELLATLSVRSDATNNDAILKLCKADNDGNPQFPTPVQQTTLVMMGDRTMQDSAPGDDTPVVLTPVWLNVLQSSGDAAPSFVIGSALSGTVAGVAVVSTQVPHHPASDGDSGKGKDWEFSFNKVVAIIGALAGLAMVYDIFSKKYQEWKTKKEAARKAAQDQEDLERAEAAADQEAQGELADPVNGVEAQVAANQPNVDRVVQGQLQEGRQRASERVRGQLEQKANDVQEQLDREIVEGGIPPSPQIEAGVRDFRQGVAEAPGRILNGDPVDAVMDPVNRAATGLADVTAQSSAEVRTGVVEMQKSVVKQKQQLDELKDREESQEKKSRDVDENDVENSQEEEPENEELDLR